MIKFSVILTVYNAEKYLNKCLDSIVNQTFRNFEIIIVNDGSTDNSQQIIDKYAEKYSFIHTITKENGGVSSARNFGVLLANGEYFTFIDSDDYVADNLLETLDRNIPDNLDILSYNMQKVDEVGNIIDRVIKPSFDTKSGEEAIVEFISKANLFDTPVGYVYRAKYFTENKFEYAINKYHEDFGLTPAVILHASSVKSIADILYNYTQTNDSITRTTDYDKAVKKANDMLYHFDYLLNDINSSNVNENTKKIFRSFISNSLILKSNTLKEREKKEYVKELKKRRVADLLLANTFPRYIKKLIFKIRM